MPNAPTASTDALLHFVLAGGAPEPRLGLLAAHGSAEAALRAGPSAWRAAGCSAAQRALLARPDPALLARGRQWLQVPRHHLLSIHDEDYPALLRDQPRAPLALFVDGDPAALWHPGVAVVGSRSPTPSGAELAAEFATAFAREGLSVISGLASGVDARAHQAALAVAGGVTVAVVGTGPDQVFPPQHAALQARIAASGAVVSEYPPGTPARAGQFPARNRIVAALALGTVVIEAAQRSGALITARLAAEAGREVFALPGSVRNPRARGCHRLIREGVQLVEQPGEVIAPLAAVAARLGAALQTRLGAPTEQRDPVPAVRRPPRDPDYHRLWLALDENPTGMDSLIERTGLTAARLSAMLQLMELDGKVVANAGGHCRKP